MRKTGLIFNCFEIANRENIKGVLVRNATCFASFAARKRAGGEVGTLREFRYQKG